MSDWWSGYSSAPLLYRPMYEWQQLAMSGHLRPDEQLYDYVRGVWQRAADHPALHAYFPAPRVNWPAVLGLGALAMIALAAARSSTNDSLRGLDWVDLKREIFRRDSYTCVYCGHRGNVLTLHVDHVTPRSLGGSDDPREPRHGVLVLQPGEGDAHRMGISLVETVAMSVGSTTGVENMGLGPQIYHPVPPQGAPGGYDHRGVRSEFEAGTVKGRREPERLVSVAGHLDSNGDSP